MRRVLAAVALVLGLGACTDPGSIVQDEATCPGERCTDDARQVYDAIAAVDGVTAVASVSRSDRLDRGAARSAEVSAGVADEREAASVARHVLRILDDWPEAAAGDAVVTVAADPGVPSPPVVERQWLSPDFYDDCTPAACGQAVADLAQAVVGAPGVTAATTEVRGARLHIDVDTDEPAGRMAASVLDLTETDLDRQVARQVVVTVNSTAPLSLILRLSDGQVCAQPAGMVVACDSSNSTPFS